MRPLFALPLLALLTAPLPAQEKKEPFFFRPKDRVVFLGDSITDQYQYTNTIELYLVTRFPKAEFVFLNAGIGGDTAHGGAGRFQSHVLDDKPTAVTINFGMNDGGYGKFDENRNKLYREKTAAMLKMAADAGVRVALVSPNAVDVRTKPGLKEYLDTQKQFYAPLKEIAGANKVPFADQYAVTRAALEKMTADDPKAAKANPFPDGVHTNGSGGLLMAHAILTQLNAPAVVSQAMVVASGKIDRGPDVGCKVEVTAASDAGVAFTRTDDALPMPVAKDWRAMLPYTNELKDLNHYGLVVPGLKEGSYDVLCDGVKVATHTAKDLAAGVNLGNAEAGPLYDQGKKVFDAINARNQLVRTRFHDVLRYNPPGWVKIDNLAEQKKAEATKRLPKIEEEQNKVWELAQPKPHKWEVKAAAE